MVPATCRSVTKYARDLSGDIEKLSTTFPGDIVGMSSAAVPELSTSARYRLLEPLAFVARYTTGFAGTVGPPPPGGGGGGGGGLEVPVPPEPPPQALIDTARTRLATICRKRTDMAISHLSSVLQQTQPAGKSHTNLKFVLLNAYRTVGSPKRACWDKLQEELVTDDSPAREPEPGRANIVGAWMTGYSPNAEPGPLAQSQPRCHLCGEFLVAGGSRCCSLSSSKQLRSAHGRRMPVAEYLATSF